ncbi:hypothetical protein BASA81_005483 [Batrachochytrium salamandrivorans]|nr:hypothetical protein BASA81_005483 [Batrachochytrium salamandrivorans]
MDTTVLEVSRLLSKVDEIGVVFEDRRDVLFVENKLGIPKPLLFDLFQYCKTLPDDSVDKWAIGLICNGDDALAWSHRKQHVLQTLDFAWELQFNALILSKQPKSHGAWEHRRFVFNLVPNKSSEFLLQEIALCDRVCVRHPRTYYAWAHRALVCSWMDSQALRRERFMVKTWMNANPSDASAAHHFSVIIRLLFDRDVELVLKPVLRIRCLVQDLEWATSLMMQTNSVWQVRRAISHRLLWELSQTKFTGDEFRAVEVDADLSLDERFEAYEWSLLQQEFTGEVNAETVLQILLDELAEAMRSGREEEEDRTGVTTRMTGKTRVATGVQMGVWLAGELAALLPHKRVPVRFAAVLVNPAEEQSCALLVLSLVYHEPTYQFHERSAEAFLSAKLFGQLLGRFDAVDFPLVAFAETYLAPQHSLEAFQHWLVATRSERLREKKKPCHAFRFYLALLEEINA